MLGIIKSQKQSTKGKVRAWSPPIILGTTGAFDDSLRVAGHVDWGDTLITGVALNTDGTVRIAIGANKIAKSHPSWKTFYMPTVKQAPPEFDKEYPDYPVLTSICWTGSLFVISASGATNTARKVLTSTDGEVWTVGANPVTIVGGAFFDSVHAINGKLYALIYVDQDASYISESTDNGNTWSGLSVIAAGTQVSRLVWNGTTFVAFGTKGKVYTSPDGVTWTYRSGLLTAVPAAGSWLQYIGAAWGGGVFAAFGDNGAGATSPDGITWTAQTGLSSSAWGSSDRVTNMIWASGTTPKFIAVGESGKVAQSLDGITWTVPTVSGPTLNDAFLFSVAASSNGEFIAGGELGLILMRESSDTWQKHVNVSSYDSLGNLLQWTWGTAVSSIAANADQSTLVAIGAKGCMAISTNYGDTWVSGFGLRRCGLTTRKKLPYVDTVNAFKLYHLDPPLGDPKIEFVGGKFVVFFPGFINSGKYAITESNPQTWTYHTGLTTAGFNLLRHVKAANGVFLAVGTEELAVSTDLITWTRTALAPADSVQFVASSGAKFVLCPYSGVFKHSPDGVTWTNSASRPSDAAKWLGGTFRTETGYTSPDGDIWTQPELPVSNPAVLIINNASVAGGGIVTLKDLGNGTVYLNAFRDIDRLDLEPSPNLALQANLPNPKTVLYLPSVKKIVAAGNEGKITRASYDPV